MLAENTSLGDEVRNAQENLRLSTGQIGRLTAEFKAMQTQNAEMKKQLEEVGTKHVPELENRIAVLSQEIERLNGVL